MINGRSVLAIIPARGGSKGLSKKNILPLKNKPLIVWTIEAGLSSKYIDRLVLSSEDAEIIAIAKIFGCEVPFVRPEELAQDNTPSIDVILHCLEQLKEKYDFIMLLQPTSPLRLAQDIDACLELCVKNNAASCVSVAESEKNPFLMYQLDNNDCLVPLLKNEHHYTRRQDMPIFFTPNGAIYLAERSFLLKESTFFAPNTLAYRMPRIRSIDIDTALDLSLAEFFM